MQIQRVQLSFYSSPLWEARGFSEGQDMKLPLLDLLSQKWLVLLAHLSKGKSSGTNYIHGSSLKQGTPHC